jgi:hypothetical protein
LSIGLRAFFWSKKMTIYQKYEALKQEYVRKNPDATNDEYEAAIAAICEVVGL